MKTCYACKQKLSLDLFNKNKSNKDGLQDKCKECDRLTARTRYKKSSIEKDKAIHRKNLRIEANQNNMNEYLKDKKCSCGFNNPLALQFDHLDRKTKEYNISDMISRGLKWMTILKEIAKCQILCANCHSIKTAKENNSYRYGSLT